MRTMLICFVTVGLGTVGAAYLVIHHKPVERPTPVVAQPAPPPVAQPVACPAKPVTPKSQTITAVGTVRPEELIEVGAQINGTIEAFGADPANPAKPIDRGTFVKKGTILAKIDTAVYQAQVDYAEASLSRAKADFLQIQARCDQAKNEWLRAQSLLPEKAIADSDYDMIASNYHVAVANMTVGQAAIQQCEAQLRIAKTQLGYTVIRSPIDGVVLERRVSIGQAVMAVFNAPGLFSIAKDLRRVQVWAPVKETDIGRIHPGLPVQFTLDAYPGKAFQGWVSQILLNPTRVESCNAYTVVVATDHCQGLLPYLTANLRFEVERRAKVEPAARPTEEAKKDAPRPAGQA